MFRASGEGERGSFTILTLSVRVVPWNSWVSEPDQQSDAASALPLLGHQSPARTPAGAATTRSADAARSAGRRPHAGALWGADSGAEAGPPVPSPSGARAPESRLPSKGPWGVILFLPRNAVAPAAVPREIHRRGFWAAAPSLSRDALCRAREPCHGLDGDPSAPGIGCSVPGYPCMYWIVSGARNPTLLPCPHQRLKPRTQWGCFPARRTRARPPPDGSLTRALPRAQALGSEAALNFGQKVWRVPAWAASTNTLACQPGIRPVVWAASSFAPSVVFKLSFSGGSLGGFGCGHK